MRAGVVEKLYQVGFDLHISAVSAEFRNRERLATCAAALGKPVDELELFQVQKSSVNDVDFWQSDVEAGVTYAGHLWPQAIYLFPLYATNPPHTYVFAR